MNKRLPYDAEAAKKLLADAGYPNGFEVGMNCPNDRYVNDAAICQAVAANLARIGVKINLQAETKGTYFPKILRRDTSFYLLGWTPTTYDSHDALTSLMATPDDKGPGQFNLGAYCNPKLDELTKKIQSETDKTKRNAMIKEAFKIHQDDVGHIPLHQQALAWASARRSSLVQLPNNYMYFKWMTLKSEVGDAALAPAGAGVAPARRDLRRAGGAGAAARAAGRAFRQRRLAYVPHLAGGDRRGRRRAGLRVLRGVRRLGGAAQPVRPRDARAGRRDAAAGLDARAARPSTCSAPTTRAATSSRR